jgi:hypothetical protein
VPFDGLLLQPRSRLQPSCSLPRPSSPPQLPPPLAPPPPSMDASDDELRCGALLQPGAARPRPARAPKPDGGILLQRDHNDAPTANGGGPGGGPGGGAGDGGPALTAAPCSHATERARPPSWTAHVGAGDVQRRLYDSGR